MKMVQFFVAFVGRLDCYNRVIEIPAHYVDDPQAVAAVLQMFTQQMFQEVNVSVTIVE